MLSIAALITELRESGQSSSTHLTDYDKREYVKARRSLDLLKGIVDGYDREAEACVKETGRGFDEGFDEQYFDEDIGTADESDRSREEPVGGNPSGEDALPAEPLYVADRLCPDWETVGECRGILEEIHAPQEPLPLHYPAHSLLGERLCPIQKVVERTPFSNGRVPAWISQCAFYGAPMDWVLKAMDYVARLREWPDYYTSLVNRNPQYPDTLRLVKDRGDFHIDDSQPLLCPHEEIAAGSYDLSSMVVRFEHIRCLFRFWHKLTRPRNTELSLLERYFSKWCGVTTLYWFEHNQGVVNAAFPHRVKRKQGRPKKKLNMKIRDYEKCAFRYVGHYYIRDFVFEYHFAQIDERFWYDFLVRAVQDKAPGFRDRMMARAGMHELVNGCVMTRLEWATGENRWVYEVPREAVGLRRLLIRSAHRHTAHGGLSAMVHYLLPQWHAANMRPDCGTYRSRCLYCNITQAKRTWLLPPLAPRHVFGGLSYHDLFKLPPFTAVAIDFLEVGGNRHVLTVTCLMSRKVAWYLVCKELFKKDGTLEHKAPDGTTVMDGIHEAKLDHGFGSLRLITCDVASYFNSGTFTRACLQSGSRVLPSTRRAAWEHGQAERLHQSGTDILRSLLRYNRGLPKDASNDRLRLIFKECCLILNTRPIGSYIDTAQDGIRMVTPDSLAQGFTRPRENEYEFPAFVPYTSWDERLLSIRNHFEREIFVELKRRSAQSIFTQWRVNNAASIAKGAQAAKDFDNTKVKEADLNKAPRADQDLLPVSCMPLFSERVAASMFTPGSIVLIWTGRNLKADPYIWKLGHILMFSGRGRYLVCHAGTGKIRHEHHHNLVLAQMHWGACPIIYPNRAGSRVWIKRLPLKERVLAGRRGEIGMLVLKKSFRWYSALIVWQRRSGECALQWDVMYAAKESSLSEGDARWPLTENVWLEKEIEWRNVEDWEIVWEAPLKDPHKHIRVNPLPGMSGKRLTAFFQELRADIDIRDGGRPLEMSDRADLVDLSKADLRQERQFSAEYHRRSHQAAMELRRERRLQAATDLRRQLRLRRANTDMPQVVERSTRAPLSALDWMDADRDERPQKRFQFTEPTILPRERFDFTEGSSEVSSEASMCAGSSSESLEIGLPRMQPNSPDAEESDRDSSAMSEIAAPGPPSDAPDLIVAAPKKRGRPPKPKVAAPAPKRGRGRPKKSALAKDIATLRRILD